VRVPENVDGGYLKITVAYPEAKDHQVEPATFLVPIIKRR
jgi:hypothetical protein